MSGEVRKFWLKINKVIAFKQKVEADEARQKVIFISCLGYYCFLALIGNGQAFSVPGQANGKVHDNVG